MEPTSTSAPSSAWLQEAFKKGLPLAIIHVFVFVLLYYLAPSKMTGFSYLFFVMVLNMGYAIYCGISYRNELGGFIEYGPAFKFTFVIFLTSAIIGTLFGLLFLLIEPAYPEVMAQSQLDTSVYWAQRFGAPESALDDMKEKFDMEEVQGRYSGSGLLFGFGFVLLFDALGASIAALFIRKKVPETF